MNQYMSVLTEAGISVDFARFATMNEANQLKVTDDTLTGLMKFITDKYNSLDFGEIEKSAGDISRFKYTGMIKENADILGNIYEQSDDPGASKYVEVVKAIEKVMDFMSNRRSIFSELYKSGNGMVQLTYTSLVAACLYSTGVLVSNTIRFVTTEQNTDCEVLYDEIPGTIKQVHIKNILAVANDLDSVDKMLKAFDSSKYKEASMTESVVISGAALGVLIAAGVLFMIPRIIVLIREIIYSIYYSRVKCSEMLALQIDLLNTNIESLEAGRGNKKVIARQKKIAKKLEIWKNRVAVKMDTAEQLKKVQEKKENSSLAIDKYSPLAGPEESSSGILL